MLRALTDYKRGDFSIRLPVEKTGIAGKIYDRLNDIIEFNQRTAKEIDRMGSVVGKGGDVKHRVAVAGAGGQGAAQIDALSILVTELTQPPTGVARVSAPLV